MTAPALPAPASRRGRLPLTALGIAVVLCAAAAIAIPRGTATHRAAPAPANADSLIAGKPLQSARCSNWLRASAADKALAIRALQYSVGGPTEYKGARGTTLTDAQGYQLLDNTCASPIARHFLLYELYIRAAAFKSLVPAQP